MERGEGLERRGGGSFNGSLFVLGKGDLSHPDCSRLGLSLLDRFEALSWKG